MKTKNNKNKSLFGIFYKDQDALRGPYLNTLFDEESEANYFASTYKDVLKKKVYVKGVSLRVKK